MFNKKLIKTKKKKNKAKNIFQWRSLFTKSGGSSLWEKIELLFFFFENEMFSNKTCFLWHECCRIRGSQWEGSDTATQQPQGRTLLQPTRKCGSVRAGQVESAEPSSSPPEGAEVSELADNNRD